MASQCDIANIPICSLTLSSYPPRLSCSLGYFTTEQGAARAHDVVSAWRNRQIIAQLAARGHATPRRARSEASTGDGQARKRSPSQLLPLNLPDQAPRADDPRLRDSLEDLLASVRGKRWGSLLSWRLMFE